MPIVLLILKKLLSQGVLARLTLKFLIVLVWVFASSIHNSQACDGCAYYEYNSMQNKSFFGVFYRLRQFNGYSQAGIDPQWRWTASEYRNARISHEIANTDTKVWSPSSKDFMRLESWDFRFNHQLHIPHEWLTGNDPRQELFLNVSAQWGYSRNAYYLGHVQHFSLLSPPVLRDSIITTSGMQDIRTAIAAIYTLQRDYWKHTFSAGTLLRLPVGLASARDGNQQLIHPELQPGTGAWDVMPRIAYQAIYDDWGLDVSTIYRFAGTNGNGYKFGDGLNLQADVYYMWGLGQEWRLVPRLGVYHETENQHTQNRELVNGTGGRATFGTAQLDVMFRTTALMVQYQQPIQNRLNGNQLLNAGRLNVGLVYSW